MSIVQFILRSLEANGPMRPAEIAHLYWQQTAIHLNQTSLRSTIYRLSRDRVITHLPGSRYSVKSQCQKASEQVTTHEWVLNVLREREGIWWDADMLAKRFQSEFRHEGKGGPNRGYFEDLLSHFKKKNIVWDGGRIGVAWNPGDDNPLKVTASDLASLTG